MAPPQRSRVVVTGATGNVGSALVARLAATGHDVVGIARRPPPEAGDVGWVALDLTRAEDEPALRAAVEGADAVVHLAWGFQPSHRLDLLEELGVGGTRRVLEAVTDAGVPHLVHMSSVGTYSPRTGSDPVDESYPRDGVPSSPYSRHKAAAERLLDRADPRLVVTRLRPGIIGQQAAGSALLRYGVPGFVPAGLLRFLPLLPLDRRLAVPVVDVHDVVHAVLAVLDRRAAGAFNLAADEPMTADLLARAFSAAQVHVPAPLLRGAVSAGWHARLLQLDPGWVDLAYAVPLLDTSRASAELDWRPRSTAADVVDEIVRGLVTRSSGPTAVLRRRTLADQVRRLVTDGPVHARRRP